MALVNYTLKQVKKIKSLTDWHKVKDQEPDLTDPDALEFTKEMFAAALRPGRLTEKELKSLAKEKPEHTALVKFELAHRAADKKYKKAVEANIVHRMGRPKKAVCKEHVNLRLDSFALSTLRRSGKGWQTRVSNFISAGVKAGALN
jgi:uncharacterized protein (DUF4415 family)